MDGGRLGAVAGRRRAVHRVLLLAAVPLEPVCKHKRIDGVESTLRAPLSGTFLQTLPDLSYATEGALFISAQLSSDSVSALRKVRVLIIYDCRSNLAPKQARKHETHPPWVKKKKKKKKREFRLSSNDCGFICAGVKLCWRL